MAVAAQARRPGGTVPAPAVNGSGRVPPGRETAPRRAARSGFDYSRFRQTVSTMEDFTRYVAGYPDKKGLCLYLYRLRPAIDMGLIGVRESVQLKISNPAEMSEADITAKMGRGKYMLTLNDANREKGEREVMKTWLTVSDPTAPDPVYDVRTLKLGESENIDEVNRLIEKGVLIRDGATNLPRLKTDRDKSEMVIPAAGGGDLISRDVMGQVLLQLIKQGTAQPGEVISNALSLARVMVPEQRGITAEEIEAIIDRRLAAVQSAAQHDPLAAWSKVNAFVEQVRGPVAAAGAAITSDATLAGVNEILKSSTALIPEVIRGIEFIQAQRRANAAAINARAAAGNGAAAPAAADAKPVTMADKINEVCQLAFQQMNEGITGFDFASYLCQWHPGGLEVFRFLFPHGVTGTMGLLTMNPDGARLLADPATRTKVETFLTDFFDYNPDPEPDEEDDPPPVESSGAAPAASSR